ncbi:MAG: hypothetical protein HGJ94_13845, partial [Desulfosarcina sp.]|nr:hypothetical protein [Desulfosarcina sp.]
MNNIKRILGISFLTLLLFPLNLYAWDDKEVHPILSEAAIYNSVLNSQNLKINLAMKDGVEEIVNGMELFKWIKLGSTLEDKAPRFLNHFHNPINPIESWDTAGLDDFLFSGKSSVLWAQDSGTQEGSAGGDWSWSKTRDYYHNSLIAIDRNVKEKEFSNALLGLGHQIHLLQDMAVPAHVRNDAHPLPYNAGGAPNIEKWAAQNRSTIKNIGNAATITTDVPLNQSTVSNGVVLAPTARLSDNDQYDGSNPSTSVSTGLAEYTNANFFSDDTIFTENAGIDDPHGFPFPKKTSTDLQSYIDANKLPATVIAKDGVEDVGFWIEKTGDGEEITHFVKPTYFTYEISPETHPALYHRLFYLDEACHRDYAEKLIPRAIGYSAALLDYFFRGTIQISPPDEYIYSVIDGGGADQQFENIKAKLHNTTPDEAMLDGTLVAVARYKRRIDYVPDLSANEPPLASSREA